MGRPMELSQPPTTADGANTVSTILLVGTYPPTRCGIATFTHDLRTCLVAHPSAPRCDVVAINPAGGIVESAPEVSFTIRPHVREDYRAAAAFVNEREPDLLCIQHEFGLFGGSAGSNLLDLLGPVSCPIATVLHTVLERPSTDEDRVFKQLLQCSTALIVMTEPARELLLNRWQVSAEMIYLIPHGVPDAPRLDAESAKRERGWSGRTILLSFGLLSPDKGIATAIRAMPRIVALNPTALYVVAGITHPNLLAHEGEQHRESLVALASECGVSEHVLFLNDYLSTDQLVACIQASDLCLMPYRNPDQVTSGTLSYALALDRLVVATPFAHARAALTNGGGVIVPFEEPFDLATAVIDLLHTSCCREGSAVLSTRTNQPPVWRSLGDAYVRAFQVAR